MVGRLLSYWGGLFSGAMLVSGRVKHMGPPVFDPWPVFLTPCALFFWPLVTLFFWPLVTLFFWPLALFFLTPGNPVFLIPGPVFLTPDLFFWPLVTLFFWPLALFFLTPGNLVFLTPGPVFLTPDLAFLTPSVPDAQEHQAPKRRHRSALRGYL